MIDPGKKIKRGLQEKILRLCVVIVLIVIIAFAAIGISEIGLLRQMVRQSSDSQNKAIKDKSEELVWVILNSDVMGTSTFAAQNTDDIFWSLTHDFYVLRSQVQDVFMHPERYEGIKINPPKPGPKGRFSLQLLFAEWADPNDQESLNMAYKLANLAPMMQEIIEGNGEYTVDCYISLTSGLTVIMDDTPGEKIFSDGTVMYYDPAESDWYKGAVETGNAYFSSIVKTELSDDTELGFGVPVYVGDELVAVLHGSMILNTIQNIVSQITYGESGFSILVSDDGQLIYSPYDKGDLAMDANLSRDIRETDNEDLKALIETALKLDTGNCQVKIDDENFYAYYAPVPTLGWTQILFLATDELDYVPQYLLNEMDNAKDEVFNSYTGEFRMAMIIILVVMAALIAGAVILAFVFSKRLVTPVDIMTKRVRNMTGDDMNFEMEKVYETGDEIEVLAHSFAALTDKIKNYIVEITAISAEKERIDTEMATASMIQDSMLPRKFPAFPERHEFDLYAAMKPAKEVGGDLYDFYFIDEDHLALVIGDVSGKGISASLFMVMAKHIIQNQILLHNGSVVKAMKSVNTLLNDENDAMMFVTIWLGVLTVSTGHLAYVNAGHEYPIIYRNGGKFELFRDNHGAPVAVTKDFEAQLNEIDLGRGDVLYLYTDGITEARRDDDEMFGDERIVEVLNQNKDANMIDLDGAVRAAVNDFVDGAEQFDDITSLCIRYNGV